MNNPDWFDMVRGRSHDGVVWLTTAERNEIAEAVRGSVDRFYPGELILGQRVCLLDEPPRSHCPVCGHKLR